MKKTTLVFVCSLLLSIFSVQAQESVNATGGNAVGSGGSVSYSVGQVVYTTNNGSFGSVTHGVQQPFEISAVTAIEDAEGISLAISAYPNPTTDFLTLIINDYAQTRHALSKLSFQVYDLNGKLLQSDKITGKQTSIDMSNLAASTYFVKVIKTQSIASQQEIKTFKIVKRE